MMTGAAVVSLIVWRSSTIRFWWATRLVFLAWFVSIALAAFGVVKLPVATWALGVALILGVTNIVAVWAGPKDKPTST